MFGKRSIDDLLGPAGEDGGQAPRRDRGWLREWPLLGGLMCSFALIGGAMLVDAPDAPPVAQAKASSAAAADYSAGDVVDVGEEEPADGAAEPPAEEAKPAESKAKKSKKPASGAPEVSDSESSSGASTGSTGEAAAPKRTSSRRAPSSKPPAPAKIVNVTGTSASVTNGPLAYTLSAPTHSPAVGKSWVLSVSATQNGKPLSGKVKVDILHQGTIVGHAAKGALRNGRFAHDFDWPNESVGHPLTVKATVSGGGVQQSFLFDVRVKAAG